VRRLVPPLALVVFAGCSNLSEVDGGVVALEVTAPDPAVIEVNESLPLSVRALNKDGDSVAAPIVWSVADTTLAVDPASGVLTGVAPGPGRVFASVGNLNSAVLAFSVLAPADTIVIPGDSVFTVAAGVTTSPSLTVRLESFAPVSVLEERPVIFALTSPDPATVTPTVALPNALVEDTVLTAADGTASVTLTELPGFTPPLTAIVTVRATRTRGAVVPGSGQHFTVTFQ
jgi:hypothetical protein